MAGRNRFEDMQKSASKRLVERDEGPCVFVSHQFADKDAAAAIALYIRELDVDVWFDADDTDLQLAVLFEDHNAIARAVQRGLERSTHALCVISRNSKESWWVPYEIGYATHRRAEIAQILVRDVTESDLPSYLKIAAVLQNERELEQWVPRTLTEWNLRKAANARKALTRYVRA